MAEEDSERREAAYETRECVGKGAFGEAFLVVHKASQSKYVLKRVRMARQSAWQRNATLQEVKLVSSLSHPFIVPFKESWTHHGHTVHIVYGFCEKGDLASAVQKQKGKHVEEEQVRLWLAQLLLALDYMHANKVLHRDLKASNIFLTAEGDVQVGDFGLATFRDTEDDCKHDQSLVGTPHYMSPELLAQRVYSFQSDVWSLGCVIYELCAMRPAFNAFNLAGLVTKIRRSGVAPLPACYTEDLVGIIKSMLRKDPARRASIHELLTLPSMRPSLELAFRRGAVLTPDVVLPPLPPLQRPEQGAAASDIAQDVDKSPQAVLTRANEGGRHSVGSKRLSASAAPRAPPDERDASAPLTAGGEGGQADVSQAPESQQPRREGSAATAAEGTSLESAAGGSASGAPLQEGGDRAQRPAPRRFSALTRPAVRVLRTAAAAAPGPGAAASPREAEPTLKRQKGLVGARQESQDTDSAGQALSRPLAAGALAAADQPVQKAAGLAAAALGGESDLKAARQDTGGAPVGGAMGMGEPAAAEAAEPVEACSSSRAAPARFVPGLEPSAAAGAADKRRPSPPAAPWRAANQKASAAVAGAANRRGGAHTSVQEARGSLGKVGATSRAAAATARAAAVAAAAVGAAAHLPPPAVCAVPPQATCTRRRVASDAGLPSRAALTVRQARTRSSLPGCASAAAAASQRDSSTEVGSSADGRLDKAVAAPTTCNDDSSAACTMGVPATRAGAATATTAGSTDGLGAAQASCRSSSSGARCMEDQGRRLTADFDNLSLAGDVESAGYAGHDAPGESLYDNGLFKQQRRTVDTDISSAASSCAGAMPTERSTCHRRSRGGAASATAAGAAAAGVDVPVVGLLPVPRQAWGMLAIPATSATGGNPQGPSAASPPTVHLPKQAATPDTGGAANVPRLQLRAGGGGPSPGLPPPSPAACRANVGRARRRASAPGVGCLAGGDDAADENPAGELDESYQVDLPHVNGRGAEGFSPPPTMRSMTYSGPAYTHAPSPHADTHTGLKAPPPAPDICPALAQATSPLSSWLHPPTANTSLSSWLSPTADPTGAGATASPAPAGGTPPPPAHSPMQWLDNPARGSPGDSPSPLNMCSLDGAAGARGAAATVGLAAAGGGPAAGTDARGPLIGAERERLLTLERVLGLAARLYERGSWQQLGCVLSSVRPLDAEATAAGALPTWGSGAGMQPVPAPSSPPAHAQVVNSAMGSQAAGTVSKAAACQNSSGEGRLGERIAVGDGAASGVVRYHGPAHWGSGEYFGLELDDPKGTSEGVVDGVCYFRCSPGHATFVPVGSGGL